MTEVTAGSKGGNAISPAVGIAIDYHTVLARIGTPGPRPFAATGDIVIRGTHDGASTVTGNADAAGSDVAVGAVIVINIVDIDPIAGVARNITGASLWLIATTTMHASAVSKASAQGTSSSTAGGDQNSDQQTGSQLNGTPSTSGKTGTLPSAGSQVSQGNSDTSGESGQSSDGVGVGAAISVNWVVVENEAIVAPGLTIVVTGMLAALATNETDAVAKAGGTSTKIEGGNNIGAAVSLNVVTLTNRGSIGAGSTVTAGAVAVAGVTPAGARNDFQAWAIAAAGGTGDASVAGSVAVQVLQLVNEAVIGEGSTLTVAGGIGLSASNPMGLQALAASGAITTSGSGVGAGIIVQYVDTTTLAHIDSSVAKPTTIDARGAILGSATTSISTLPAPELSSSLPDLPEFTAVAIGAAAGGGDVAIGGSIIIDVVNRTTQAFLGDGAVVNQHIPTAAAQDLAFTASDQTTFIELAGAIALTTGSAGVGFALIVGVHNKDVRAYVGKNVTADVGGSVWLGATAGETFTEIAAGAGASGDAAVLGSFVVLIVNQGSSAPGTRAYVDGGSARTATTLRARGSMTIAASDPVDMTLFAGNIGGGGSAGVGVSPVVFVRTGIVDAFIAARDVVWARGGAGLSITAAQSENQWLVAVAGTLGGSAGVAGAAAVGVQTNTTHAHIDRGALVDALGASGWQSALLSATDTTTLRSVAGQLAVGGSAGVGAGADVEVVSKDTQAWIAPQALVMVTGDVGVDALSSEDLISISAGGSFAGTASVAVNAAVSVYTIVTKAFVGETCTTALDACTTSRAVVIAGGTARITANEVLAMTIIAGSIAIGGTAGVGVAAAVPVLNKTTTAFVGDLSRVTALGGGSGLAAATGGYTAQYTDTRFDPRTAIQGDGRTIDLGYVHGLTEGQQVGYDTGGGQAIVYSIGGGPQQALTRGGAYYVHVVSPTKIQLSATKGGPVFDLFAPLRPGESQRVYASDQGTVPKVDAPYFRPGDVTGGNGPNDSYISLPYDLALNKGDAVVYTANGGTPIGGLVDGATYYVIPVAGHPFAYQLAATACDADPTGSGCSGAAHHIVLTPGAATGRAHSIVKQGTQAPGDPALITGFRTLTPASGQVWGVAITANNSDEILAVGVTAAAAATVGVAAGGNVNVVTAHTDAFIGRRAQVNAANTGASPFQSVIVGAGSAFHQLMVSAAIGGGFVGIGVSAAVDIVSLNTNAGIMDGAVVNAARDVRVTASGQADITSAAASLGAGAVGVAVAVAVLVLNTHTHAVFGEGVTVDAGNNALVAAADATRITTVSGGIGVGFVGVGMGAAVVSVSKDTLALIGRGSIVDARALAARRTARGHPDRRPDGERLPERHAVGTRGGRVVELSRCSVWRFRPARASWASRARST